MTCAETQTFLYCNEFGIPKQLTALLPILRENIAH
jgi:hypothetical protein